MSITTRALLETAILSKKQSVPFTKNITSTSNGSGHWIRLWGLGGDPGAGAEPATTPGTQYSATGVGSGALGFPTPSGVVKILASMGIMTDAQNGVFMLYDRLVGVGTLALTVATTLTVNSAALTRYTGTSALDVQAWYEITTTISSGTAIFHMSSYTDAAGATAQSGGTVTLANSGVNSGIVNMMGPMPIAAATKGIRSVESLVVDSTTATLGIVNIVLIKPLAFLPANATRWFEDDYIYQYTQTPRIFDGATLSLAYLGSTNTTAVQCAGHIDIIAG